MKIKKIGIALFLFLVSPFIFAAQNISKLGAAREQVMQQYIVSVFEIATFGFQI